MPAAARLRSTPNMTDEQVVHWMPARTAGPAVRMMLSGGIVGGLAPATVMTSRTTADAHRRGLLSGHGRGRSPAAPGHRPPAGPPRPLCHDTPHRPARTAAAGSRRGATAGSPLPDGGCTGNPIWITAGPRPGEAMARTDPHPGQPRAHDRGHRPGDPGQERRAAGLGRAGGTVCTADLVDLPQAPAGGRRRRRRRPERLAQARGSAGQPARPGCASRLAGHHHPGANAAASCAPPADPATPVMRWPPGSSRTITPRRPSRACSRPSGTRPCVRRSGSCPRAASSCSPCSSKILRCRMRDQRQPGRPGRQHQAEPPPLPGQAAPPPGHHRADQRRHLDRHVGCMFAMNLGG